MTDIETRLREGLRAEAARVQPDLLRQLRFPSRHRLHGRWRRRSGPPLGPRLLPWLAPLAAALAVVAVIIGVRLGVGDRPAVAPRVTPAVTAAAPAVPIPRYYVAANLHTQAKAWVYDSATGQVLGKAGVAGQLPIAITAAADDRTFAIAFQDLYRPAFTTYMRLTLRADGHPAVFQRLRVNPPASTSPGAMALSPDGQTLALALFIDPSKAAIEANPTAAVNRVGEVELISLRTGAARTWVAAPGVGISDLSWGRGSQTLAFLAGRRGGPPNDSLGQVRVLDVSRPPGGLMKSSTPVRLRTAGGRVQSMQVTDNGAQVIAWVRMPSHPADTGRGPLVLAAFSTRTGRQLRLFSRLPTVNGGVGYGEIFSVDPSGQHILIASENAFARLDNGRVTTLPSPAQDPTEFGAW